MKPVPARADSPLFGVVVLGMSRSGTSAVTEMFHRAGFHVGPPSELLPPDASNPRGYFENLRIYEENERLLTESGGSWLEPPSPGRLLVESEQNIARLRSILAQIHAEAPSAPIAVKDPRIGVLLPVWKPAFQGLLQPVMVVRHPVEIGMSLARRDLTPIPVATAAWEVHMTGLLAALKGEWVTVVNYRRLLQEPGLSASLLSAVCERLNPALRPAIDPARAAEPNDPDLWRNRVVGEDTGGRLTSFQEELWEYLSGFPSGTMQLQPPQHLMAASPAGREAIAGEGKRVATLERLRLELAREAGARSGAEAELEALRREIEMLRRETEMLRRDTERLRGALDLITGSTSWRMTRPLRDLRRRLGQGG
jgi:hypothetical protein